jgi:hypothetical protein
MKTEINQYSIEGRKANEFLTILDELGIMYYKIRERGFLHRRNRSWRVNHNHANNRIN